MLVGLTHLHADGSVREQEQWYGVVIAYDPDEGVTLRRANSEIETLPPRLERAEPGEYTLRSTGEVVSNPDFISTWTIDAPDDPPSDVYDQFLEELEGLLETLLEASDIHFALVTSFSRPGHVTYDWNRAEHEFNQAELAGKKAKRPLESSLRLAGVKVVVGTAESSAEIADLVSREFVVDAARSLSIEHAAERNARLAQPGRSDRLTYECPYYLISLDERRLELDEWSQFSGLEAWIEVRTELQDAWEDVVEDELLADHPLPVQAAASWYPDDVRELVARSAHGLSLIDNDLAKAKHELERLHVEYQETIATDDLDLPLNVVSLSAYLKTSGLVRSLVELADDAGFASSSVDEAEWEDLDGLLSLLRGADLDTIAELEDFLQRALPVADTTLAELERLATERGFTPSAQPNSIVEWLWLVTQRADAETVAGLRYQGGLEDALNTLLGNSVPRNGG